MDPRLHELLIALAEPAARQQVCARLASQTGADLLLLFVRDPRLDTWLPAPGLPQTLPGGVSWRRFLQSCPMEGRRVAEVDFPAGQRRPVRAVFSAGAGVVLLGGDPDAAAVGQLAQALPLLGALLSAEQDARFARAEAMAAREAADRVRELAEALEQARAEASMLNAELRREHRQKDSFLAMLGHELRNPLAPLVTSLELLRLGAFSAEDAQRQLEVMSRQVTHLSRLVEDLLDVSRVSRGQIELRRESVDLREVLDDALREAEPLLANHHHRVETRVAGPLVVRGDPVRLVQVIGNLVNNAAKYTDPGGTVTCTLTRTAQEAVVRVSDDGIGIASDVLPTIFEPFIQAPGAVARGDGGLGVGLTLVRRLVELHGGSVDAASSGPGRGSTFCVRLPLAATPERQPELPVSASPARLPRLRVLVIDDNRDAADALAALLGIMGQEVRVAYDGRAGLAEAARDAPDLVLVDIGLPGMDGYQVARRLHHEVNQSLRLVAVTGYGSEEARQRSAEAGFHGHLVKPLTREVLETLLAGAGKAAAPGRIS